MHVLAVRMEWGWKKSSTPQDNTLVLQRRPLSLSLLVYRRCSYSATSFGAGGGLSRVDASKAAMERAARVNAWAYTRA